MTLLDQRICARKLCALADPEDFALGERSSPRDRPAMRAPRVHEHGTFSGAL